ncbi:uncharacterized protein I303_104346 [Kwoniella dejecticola CBS 10117]|uniref:Uncharacterized protein n=1 Tax=Kwoniella dejecticola CBS 10117 TaxID=1296121 RepID=A0A1A6A5L1_9TREE|nr:uncharacterized protein I303_04679 [Kwoniella dejecticola CBS 10117]OBR85344.1 hypothetical protein I303_04679 [Kwoniella dejecticola CBS 10117]
MQDQGDIASSTPLDLLINAIAGSADYIHQSTGPIQDASQSHVQATTTSAGDEISQSVEPYDLIREGPSYDHKQPRTVRQEEVASRLSEHIVQSYNSRSAPDKVQSSDLLSATTIEIWHPTTGQKSYGKERRIISPPPKLCISGSLLPSIKSIALATTCQSSTTSHVTNTSTCQTYSIASSSLENDLDSVREAEATHGFRGKKDGKASLKKQLMEQARNAGFGATLPKSRLNAEEKERELLLEDGLNFSGLWIGEDVQKQKEFNLELRVFTQDLQATPFMNASQPKDPSPIPQVHHNEVPISQETLNDDNVPQGVEPIAPFEGIQETPSFADVLDSSSMDVLQPLAQAVQEADANTSRTLAGHLSSLPDNAIRMPNGQVGDESASTAIGIADTDTAILSHPNQAVKTHIDPLLDNSSGRRDPYLTFVSKPLRVVSKPSQKTAKARSLTSCFAVDSSFALWTRVNAQTVRTKYMTLDHDLEQEDIAPGKLTSRTGKWTPFRFDVIKRAVPAPIPKKLKSNSGQLQTAATAVDVPVDDAKILTYGSTVRLVDLQSGMESDAVRIVKVEGGQHKLGEDEGHPISELQRIGLVRLNEDGTDFTDDEGARSFLSAPSARVGGVEQTFLTEKTDQLGRGGRAKPTSVSRKRPIPTKDSEVATDADVNRQQTLHSVEEVDSGQTEADPIEAESDAPPKKKQKTKRNALAAAVLAEDGDGGLHTVLSWIKAERETQTLPSEAKDREGRQVIVERVDDWMSWIIGGVTCSSQTIISDAPSLIQNDSHSIDPIPQILVPPIFNPQSYSLDVTLAQFYFASSVVIQEDEPLEIYLGPIGPLHYSLWRSTAPKSTPTPAIPFHPQSDLLTTSSGHAHGHGLQQVMSAYPTDKRHTIVRIYIPSAGEVLAVMKDLSAKITPSKAYSPTPDNSISANGSLIKISVPEADSGPDPLPDKATNLSPSHEEIPMIYQGEEGYFDGQAAIPPETPLNPKADKVQDDQSLGDAPGMHTTAGFETLHSLEITGVQSISNSVELPEGGGQESITNHPAYQTHDDRLKERQIHKGPPKHAESKQSQETPTTMTTTKENDGSKAGPQFPKEPIKLYKPATGNSDQSAQSTLPSLPFMLVRQSDGVAFGVGRSVVAQRLEMKMGHSTSVEIQDDNGGQAHWGLRIVED